MTAASAYPQASEAAASDARSQEPSMEDILASIRRIIADDQSQTGRPAAGNGLRRSQAASQALPEVERPVVRTRTPYDDVLDLARLVPSAAQETAALQEQHGESAEDREQAVGQFDASPIDEAPYDAEAPVSTLRARLPEPAARASHDGTTSTAVAEYEPQGDEEDDLLAAPLGASVLSAFETLAATVVLQNTPMLERVMRDLLRPMLKTWLDDNLPALVERLVRTEIERVARGRS